MPNNYPILLPPFLTPGINPNAGTPVPNNVPQGDPYAELTMLLSKLGTQHTLTPPHQGTLETILNSIASGAAILASPDPGGTLSGQLKGRQERADLYNKINFERQNNLDLMAIQSAVEKARGIQGEQQQFRKEQREQAYKQNEAKTEVDIYGKKKQIDIAGKEKEFRIEQNLLQEYEPLINARAKNMAYIQDYPKQRQDSLEWQALARTALPNLDPITAQTIGDKLSRLDRTELTLEENDLVKKANQAINTMFQQEKNVKLGKLKAETYREYQEGAYAARNKPGSGLSQSPENRFNANYAGAVGSAAADRAFARFYYKNNTTGQVITDKDLNAMGILNPESRNFTLMNPQETEAQRAIEVKRAIDAKGQVEQLQQQQQEVKPSEVPEKVQRALTFAEKEGMTPEQKRLFLSSAQVGASPELINKLVPIGGQTTAPTSTFVAPKVPTPLVQSQRPRQVNPPTEEERKAIEDIKKVIEKQRSKRRK